MLSTKALLREPVSAAKFGSSQKRKRDFFHVVRLFKHLQIERDIAVEKISLSPLKPV